MSENPEIYDAVIADLCPRCRHRTTVYAIVCGAHVIGAHSCPRHGDVVPVRGAVPENADKTHGKAFYGVFSDE